MISTSRPEATSSLEETTYLRAPVWADRDRITVRSGRVIGPTSLGANWSARTTEAVHYRKSKLGCQEDRERPACARQCRDPREGVGYQAALCTGFLPLTKRVRIDSATRCRSMRRLHLPSTGNPSEQPGARARGPGHGFEVLGWWRACSLPATRPPLPSTCVIH